MGLKAGTRLEEIKIDVVFIGSCTNGRIEDIRAVAKVAKGKKVAKDIQALVVPGSGLVKDQAEDTKPIVYDPPTFKDKNKCTHTYVSPKDKDTDFDDHLDPKCPDGKD